MTSRNFLALIVLSKNKKLLTVFFYSILNLTFMQFLGNIFFKGKIKCATGLHIGGGQDKLEIGGVDSIVIRDPKTQYPMIPGSSFRGKLRTMIEFGLGVIHKGNPSKNIEAGSPSDAPIITRLFGKGADDKDDKKEKDLPGPTRLIVRDCMPDNQTIEMWENIETELLYTEYKAENTINRLTSAANPRFIERVAADSVFDFEIVLSVYGDTSTLKEDILNILMGLKMIQHNWIGKGGSRGSGKVEFAMENPIVVTTDDYKKAKSETYEKASSSLKEEEFDESKHIFRFTDNDIDKWITDISKSNTTAPNEQ